MTAYYSWPTTTRFSPGCMRKDWDIKKGRKKEINNVFLTLFPSINYGHCHFPKWPGVFSPSLRSLSLSRVQAAQASEYYQWIRTLSLHAYIREPFLHQTVSATNPLLKSPPSILGFTFPWQCPLGGWKYCGYFLKCEWCVLFCVCMCVCVCVHPQVRACECVCASVCMY